MSGLLELRGARLAYGTRELWSGLDLRVEPGSFTTVLGANGSGKSSLLKVVLGLQRLTAGEVLLDGAPIGRGSRRIGYVPQHRGFDADVPLRGVDLVRLGIDGRRWGLPSPRRTPAATAALEQVDAAHLATVPLGRMSGGEQQSVRIAQALATDPDVLLCDEPLLSLDPRRQSALVSVLDRRRREHGTSVVFVTHEINPVLGVSDQLLILREGRFVVGGPDEVLRSDVLSSLYGAPVEVIRRRDRVAVLSDEPVAV